jgi:hypothetical protein
LTVATTEVNDATMKLVELSNSDGVVFEVAGDGAVTVHAGGLLVDAGGLEVSAGGLLVDSGGARLDGGLEVVDGGTILNASSGVALTVNGLAAVRQRHTAPSVCLCAVCVLLFLAAVSAVVSARLRSFARSLAHSFSHHHDLLFARPLVGWVGLGWLVMISSWTTPSAFFAFLFCFFVLLAAAERCAAT